MDNELRTIILSTIQTLGMITLLRKFFMNEEIKNQGVYIKISDKIATFAYEEFFEGYATRRRIMQ